VSPQTGAHGEVGAVAVATFAGAMILPASAVPGATSSDTTDAHVQVAGAILMSGLTANFTLAGLPGATVPGPGAVTMTVATNNLAGYDVTVQSATETLRPATPLTNPDSIPIAALSVRETGATAYTRLAGPSGGAVTVHTQGVRSAIGGDHLSNDYSVDIPFVNTDTYTATLNYIATTL